MEHAATHTKIHPTSDKALLGFWLYLMTDLLMFAVLFATFAVLRENTFGGPPAKELLSMPLALSETLILLTSSFTCGLALVAARKNNKKATILFLIATFLLGISFLSLELFEFSELIAEGQSFQNSAFLSSFFTLVGTHGIHIASGLLWLSILLIPLLRKGITGNMLQKLTLFSLFWHFLDIVWIFIFTVVYLMAAL